MQRWFSGIFWEIVQLLSFRWNATWIFGTSVLEFLPKPGGHFGRLSGSLDIWPKFWSSRNNFCFEAFEGTFVYSLDHLPPFCNQWEGQQSVTQIKSFAFLQAEEGHLKEQRPETCLTPCGWDAPRKDDQRIIACDMGMGGNKDAELYRGFSNGVNLDQTWFYCIFSVCTEIESAMTWDLLPDSKNRLKTLERDLWIRMFIHVRFVRLSSVSRSFCEVHRIYRKATRGSDCHGLTIHWSFSSGVEQCIYTMWFLYTLFIMYVNVRSII